MEVFGIPLSMLPDIRYSDEVFGTVTEGCGGLGAIPICGVMGDSHAALFGQNCFERGMAKATYGTGSSIMMNIGGYPMNSAKGLVTSAAWGASGQVEFVLEGNINCTGSTINLT